MSKRRAVVIGIDQYKEEIPELKGAVHDAEEMAAILREDGDFEIAAEHLLINEDATFLNIRKAMSDLLWRSEPTDISLFYFSGHGIEDGRATGYLAPYDMNPDEPFVRGIGMQEFKAMVVGARNKTSIVGLLDCCYSGKATEDGTKAGGPEVAVDLAHHFDDFPQGTGRTILTSSGKDQKSREVSKSCQRLNGAAHEHGIFTFHLLQGLQGLAASPDGNVSLERLCTEVKRAMQNDAHAPSLYLSSVSGDTILTTVGRQRKLDQFFEEADELLSRASDNVLAVFAALDSYAKIVTVAPDLARSKDLQSRLDQVLIRFRPSGQAWLGSKRVEIGGRYLSQYQFLSSAIRILSVEEFLKLSLSRKNLLVAACFAVQEPTAYDDLLSAIEQDRNQPLSKQSQVIQAKGAGA